MRREFVLPATVSQQVLDALEDVENAAVSAVGWLDFHDGKPLATGLRIAQADGVLQDALARLAAAREQAKGTG